MPRVQGGAGAARSRGLPGTARRRSGVGAVAVPSWIPRHLAQDAGLAWHAGGPAVGPDSGAEGEGGKGARKPGPGTSLRRRAARSGALPGLLVAPGGP